MFFPHRTMCSVLEGMRECIKTHNFSVLPSLIEEAQLMGDRMEAALWDKHDLQAAYKERKKLKAEIKKLEKKRDKLAKGKRKSKKKQEEDIC